MIKALSFYLHPVEFKMIPTKVEKNLTISDAVLKKNDQTLKLKEHNWKRIKFFYQTMQGLFSNYFL